MLFFWPSCNRRRLLAARSDLAGAQQTMASSDKIWAGLKGDVFGDRAILLDTGLIRIEAPKRAQDAALVPVDIYIDPGQGAGRHQGRHHDHRRQPGAGGGDVPDRQGRRRHPSVDPRPRQRLFLSARHRRDAQRRTPHGPDLRQGVRRMLGAGGQEHRRGAGLDGQDEAAPVSARGDDDEGAGIAADDPPSRTIRDCSAIR